MKKDNRSILWIKMQDTHGKMAVKSMFDPTVKAIKGIYDTKTPTKQQIKEYKRYRKELIAGSPGICIREDLTFKTIVYSTLATAVEFKAKSVFNPYDPMMRKESICKPINIATTL